MKRAKASTSRPATKSIASSAEYIPSKSNAWFRRNDSTQVASVLKTKRKKCTEVIPEVATKEDFGTLSNKIRIKIPSNKKCDPAGYIGHTSPKCHCQCRRCQPLLLKVISKIDPITRNTIPHTSSSCNQATSECSIGVPEVATKNNSGDLSNKIQISSNKKCDIADVGHTSPKCHCRQCNLCQPLLSTTIKEVKSMMRSTTFPHTSSSCYQATSECSLGAPTIIKSGYVAPKSTPINSKSSDTENVEDQPEILSKSEKFSCDCNCSGVINANAYKKNLVDNLELTERRKLIRDTCLSDPTYDRKKGSHSKIKPIKSAVVSKKQPCSCQKVNELKTKCISSEKIKQVAEFRKENQTDTHAPQQITDKIVIPIHTCVYPFNVNERLFTTSCICDDTDKESDTARCLICNMPLVSGLQDFINKPGSGIENYEWEYIKKRQFIRNRMENYIPQEVVIKIPVSVTEQNHTIVNQLKKMENFKQLTDSPRRFSKFSLPPVVKKCYPRDSLALRFQKGVV